MKRHIPNLLTLSRLGMAIVIFFLLAFFDIRHADYRSLLDAAIAVFLVAVFTDFLDGYLARRFNTPSAFGRISDPFVDKILICGVFVYFAGPDFLLIAPDPRLADLPASAVAAPGAIQSLTGVSTWMVVLIIGREILVTGIRGFSESKGEPFAAAFFGKAKMFLQSVTILWILFLLAHGDQLGWMSWGLPVRTVLLWATVLFTLFSGLTYLDRVRRVVGMPAVNPADRPPPPGNTP